ncbi:hypothetical protein HG426_000705 [Candidatus Saccharibacteria bacterium]|jgi:hypothetical protein cdiviTM7_00602|nr:hypothetical protein [Candidatus Saccharibacteria bacterium]
MKQKLTTCLIALTSAVGALLLFSRSVYALDCAVLPDEICSKAGEGEAVFELLKFVFDICVILVGIVAMCMFVWAGILYASGDANSNRVAQAKTIMTNTIVGIIAFGLMYLGLNWLIPGGVFN